MQHFFEKNPTLFALRNGTLEAARRWYRKISAIHGIFFTGWSSVDALSIKGKYSKDAQ